jgi:hypothetical protein
MDDLARNLDPDLLLGISHPSIPYSFSIVNLPSIIPLSIKSTNFSDFKITQEKGVAVHLQLFTIFEGHSV